MAWREDAHINKLRVGDPALLQNVHTETLTGARTLTAADNGKTLVLDGTTGAAVALPELADGLNFRFIVGSTFITTDWTIVSSTNVIQGAVDVNSSTLPAVNENTVSFVASAETVGDWIDVLCDGTNWYLRGLGQAIGSVTLTAP